VASHDRDDDRTLGHAYDGIEEYDNPLPSWWVWIFWATILFSLGYYAYYQLGPGPSIVAEYEAESKMLAERAAALAPRAAAVTDRSILALRADAAVMGKAKETFATRCMPCHGAQGQGVIGPNLTDEYWLHGDRPVDFVKTITEGVPEKGMIPWKDQLSPEEIRALAAFITTLQGTNPPNAKAPEGQKVAGGGAGAAGR
jgi:cytochrome c oxidase cbb3-type subunit 3